MKENFIKYLNSIGMTDELIRKVDEIYKFYQPTLNKVSDEILDIFVTDYITNEEKREYENLWLFSKKYFMEAKLFIKQDDFDISPISKNIIYLEIKKQNYDFLNSNERSRLNINYGLNMLSGEGELKASRENCDYLKEIYFKYILPNLII